MCDCEYLSQCDHCPEPPMTPFAKAFWATFTTFSVGYFLIAFIMLCAQP